MNFQRETLFDVVEEVQPLLEKHYQELEQSLMRDVAHLNPRWDAYTELERLGMFVVLTARDGGALVGYSAYFLSASMHYADLQVASNDVFYITEPHRKGSTPMRFLRFCEHALGMLGAQKLVYHCKPQNNFAPILKRMGFAEEEIMCGKLILKGA